VDGMEQQWQITELLKRIQVELFFCGAGFRTVWRLRWHDVHSSRFTTFRDFFLFSFGVRGEVVRFIW